MINTELIILQKWQSLLQKRKELIPPHRNLPDTLSLSPSGGWQVKFSHSNDVLSFENIELALTYIETIVSKFNIEVRTIREHRFDKELTKPSKFKRAPKQVISNNESMVNL